MHQNIKNIFIFGLTLLSFGFLSAQFVIPDGIGNAYQLIERIWITVWGTATGATVVDLNTWSNNVYINPDFLPISNPYNEEYFLTLNEDGYLSFTSGTNNTISNVTVSGGNLFVGLWDGSVFNAGAIVWPQWPQGATGAQWAVWPQGIAGQQGIPGIPWTAGEPGTDGQDWNDGIGIAAIELNNDQLIITLSNNEQINIGSIVWPQGEPGVDGQDGVGISAIGNNGDGTFTIYFTNGSEFTTENFTWPQGEQGIQWEQGPQWEPGIDGQDGTSITILGSFSNESELLSLPSGNLGDGYLVNGDLYVWDGNTWVNVGNIQWPQGEQWIQWEQGLQGEPGTNGQDGFSAYELAVSNGFIGNESQWLASLIWPEGPQGIQWETGATWANWNDGLQGDMGPMWPQGPQWEVWPQGEPGATWANWNDGLQGDMGPMWPQGPQWEVWPQGEPGVDGQDGVGIAQTLSVSGYELTISEWNVVDLSGLFSFWSCGALELCIEVSLLIDRVDSLEANVSYLLANQYWTKSGINLYPTTLSDFVGIGTNDPLYPLNVSWWTLINDTFNTGTNSWDLLFFFGGDGTNASGYPIPGLSIGLNSTLWYLNIFGVDLGGLWFDDDNTNHIRYDIELWHISWDYESRVRSSMSSRDVDWPQIDLSTYHNIWSDEFWWWQCIGYSTGSTECASMGLRYNIGWYCEWFYTGMTNESACNSADSGIIQTYRSTGRAEWGTEINMELDIDSNTNYIALESFRQKWQYPCFDDSGNCSWAEQNSVITITPTGIGINRTIPEYTMDISWSLKANNYHAADNSTGINSTVLAGSCLLTFKNWLLTENSCDP